MTDALDLDALEAEGEQFSFIFDGHTYTLPPDVGLDVVELLDQGDLAGGLQALLGDEQWATIEASPKVFGVLKTLAVIEAYADHLGVDSLGGSSASTAT